MYEGYHLGETSRSEYLALDAVAFEATQKAPLSRWPFPVAVFELENSRQDAKVTYSLWKVLCVRAPLRVVFCYRRDVSAGSALVRHLGRLSSARCPSRSVWAWWARPC